MKFNWIHLDKRGITDLYFRGIEKKSFLIMCHQ